MIKSTNNADLFSQHSLLIFTKRANTFIPNCMTFFYCILEWKSGIVSVLWVPDICNFLLNTEPLESLGSLDLNVFMILKHLTV